MVKKKNTALMVGIIVLITALALFLSNNFTPFYGAFSCTFNVFDCPHNATIIDETEECSWNKYDCSCTNDIRDECCEDVPDIPNVRECEGQVEDPMQCYDKYCWDNDEHCVADQGEYQGDGYYVYNCVCSNMYI